MHKYLKEIDITQGPISLPIICSQLKFDGNLALQYTKNWSADHWILAVGCKRDESIAKYTLSENNQH